MKPSFSTVLYSLLHRFKSPNSVRYVSNIILMSGLVLGLYIRWLHSEDIAILLIAFLGLFVFAGSAALVYYFSTLDVIGFSLLRLWSGCLLGVVGFTGAPMYEDSVSGRLQTIMNGAFVASVALRFVWIVVDRVTHASVAKFTLFDSMDSLELCGLAIATLVVGKDFVSAALMCAGLLMILVSIRLKSCLGLLYLAAFITFTTLIYFPKMLEVHANLYALSCLLGRVLFAPLVDWYFVGLTSLQRWEPMLRKRKSLLRISLCFLLMIELSFLTVYSLNISAHKEWYIVVPLFSAAAIAWLGYHAIFVVISWTLINKLAECVRSRNLDIEDVSTEGVSLHRMMASKGLRYFGLIAGCITSVVLLTSLLLGVLAWTTKTPLGVGLWSFVLAVEICVCSLMGDFGSQLGGTCIGYALVAPVHSSHRTLDISSSSGACLLPPDITQDLSTRSTRALDAIQRFFTFHLIESFGADYSSGGQTLEGLQVKLRLLFERLTGDGLRYDTYVLYYCGPVYENGDWALTGGARLSLDALLSLWTTYDLNSGSRLLLILDTDSSLRWLDGLRPRFDASVAIQTWRLSPQDDFKKSSFVSDTETGGSNAVEEIGSFTSDWTDYNCDNQRGIDWRDGSRNIRAIYAVSRTWTDFTSPRSLTRDDIARYWDEHFPRAVRRLACVTVLWGCCCGRARGSPCSECVLRCVRRKRMAWLPPIECDTGHGFKLVRSLVS